LNVKHFFMSIAFPKDFLQHNRHWSHKLQSIAQFMYCWESWHKMKLFLLAALWYTVSQYNTILEGVPMKAALDHFRNAIFSPGETAHFSNSELRQFAEQCVVALAVGGEGSRLKAATESQQAHKTALRLPNDDTMAGRTIRMYRDAGFREFVALVFHHAQSVIDTLGDGSHLGVRI